MVRPCFGAVERDSVGFKIFLIEKSDPRIPSENSGFPMGCLDRIARSKTFGAKRLFFNDKQEIPSLSQIGFTPF